MSEHARWDCSPGAYLGHRPNDEDQDTGKTAYKQTLTCRAHPMLLRVGTCLPLDKDVALRRAAARDINIVT